MASTNAQGTLIVRPICAKLTRDTETFGKMDPYCVVRVGGQQQRTAVAEGAGKFPNWSDQLVFRKTNEDTIFFAVWDRDSASSDDMVGETTLPLSRFLGQANTEEWVEIMYKGRKSGEIRIGVQFAREGGSQSQGQNQGQH